MSKHAPGPWRLSVTDDTLVRSVDNGLVAVAHGDYGCDWEVMEANARLISSAPDMLEALQELVAEWDARHAAEDHRSGYTLDTAGIAMARAAIAKATGEAA